MIFKTPTAFGKARSNIRETQKGLPRKLTAEFDSHSNEAVPRDMKHLSRDAIYSSHDSLSERSSSALCRNENVNVVADIAMGNAMSDYEDDDDDEELVRQADLFVASQKQEQQLKSSSETLTNNKTLCQNNHANDSINEDHLIDDEVFVDDDCEILTDDIDDFDEFEDSLIDDDFIKNLDIPEEKMDSNGMYFYKFNLTLSSLSLSLQCVIKDYEVIINVYAQHIGL